MRIRPPALITVLAEGAESAVPEICLILRSEIKTFPGFSWSFTPSKILMLLMTREGDVMGVETCCAQILASDEALPAKANRPDLRVMPWSIRTLHQPLSPRLSD
jgi:hypothetical protein